jgi:Helix-turn-helix domain
VVDGTNPTVVTSNQAAALALVFTQPGQRVRISQGVRRAMNSAATLSGRALYTVPEAMEMLNLSRTVIYEQIRSGRLLTVTQGPSCVQEVVCGFLVDMRGVVT